MKKLSFMLAFTLLVAMLMAATGTITLQNTPSVVEVLRSNADGLSVRYAIDELKTQEIVTKEGVWTELSSAQYANTNITGAPALPLMRKLISVPLGAYVTAVFDNAQTKTIALSEYGVQYPLMPRQESVSKSADLNNLPFVVNRDFYNSNTWTDTPAISVTELGMMRGTRIFALDFVPVSYNPVLKQLEVIYNAEVKVSFSGADLAATELLKAKTNSPAFESNFASSIINYAPVRTTLNRYPLGYVIVLPDNYVTAMQPFIDWKRREGYNVIVAPTSVTGSSSTAIKTYMQNLWNAATADNPAPSYLLIVGDIAQVPSTTGTTGTHPTDLPYVRLQGTDFMPEMYFGRFSATTTAEVTNQVNKTMMHEQYTMPSDAYLGEVVMIAGYDSSWSPTHANGQINYGTNNYFNPAHGITSHTYMYPASGSSDAAIVQDVSNGVGYVNYTAHGDVTIWYDPNFTISNINSLQNTNESSFVVGNCCLTNKFDSAICFGEAWLRAPNKGAIIYIGGTNSTYWDEDYYWGVGYKPPVVGTGSPFVAGHTGAYDAVFHDHSEPFNDWAGNAGSMVLMGNLAVVASNSTRINYYWEIYSIMGDPSLVPYMGIPVQNSYQAPEQLFLGLGTLDIQADPYTNVALSMNNVIHGVGTTNATGALTLNFTPFTEPGYAQLVMTRSLRRPLIANIQVIPNVGPYVTAGQLVIADGNNDIPEAGETIAISLDFTNVGVQDATSITATLSTTNEWVILTNPTVTLPNIPAGQFINMPAIFGFEINPNIPDQTVITLEITISDGNNTWVTQRNLIVNAPNVSFGNHSFFDSNGNGIFESGEAVTVTLNIENSGHMTAGGGTLDLVLNSPYATLDVSSFMVPAMTAGNGIPLSFNVILGQGIPDGTIIPIGIALDAGIQMLNHNILMPIGAVGEGFETNSFSSFPWVNNSPIPWAIEASSSNVHSGSYAARSGAIGDYGTTSLQVTLQISNAGNVSFWRKVSSETNYDFLKFYIDDVATGSWSGTQAWLQVSYPVTAGSHTFKWTYSKDVSGVGGSSDRVWIDDIVFPSSGTANFPMIYSGTEQITYTSVMPNTTVSADFTLRNIGNAELQGIISVPAGFVLSYNGATLPSDYTYTCTVGSTQIYSLSYTAGATVSSFTAEIIISSNDQSNPTLVIPVTLTSGSANADPGLIPAVTALDTNFPNPFNPETTIRYSTKAAGAVRISIYNLKGQLIRNLVNESKAAGYHRVIWNGLDERGAAVSSGIYFYRMDAVNYSATKKMMLMK